MEALSVKELKAELDQRDVDYSGCVEKRELRELLHGDGLVGGGLLLDLVLVVLTTHNLQVHPDTVVCYVQVC